MEVQTGVTAHTAPFHSAPGNGPKASFHTMFAQSINRFHQIPDHLTLDIINLPKTVRVSEFSTNNTDVSTYVLVTQGEDEKKTRLSASRIRARRLLYHTYYKCVLCFFVTFSLKFRSHVVFSIHT